MKGIPWWWLGLALAIAGIVFAAGKWWQSANEITAAVTALYATLVFFQLWEMRLQREHQERQVDQAVKESERRRPILSATSTLRTSPEFVNRSPGGLGCYATFTVINTGRTAAVRCQPVLTMIYERHLGVGGKVNWIPVKSWIPLPLLWSLDEPNIAADGRPTQDRDLVPHRPYLFDLGNCSSRDPDAFHLRPTVHPFSQETSFKPGERCFEITVFSENAEPIKKWVHLNWHGSFALPSERLDLEYLRNPPHEVMQRIQFVDLPGDPSAS
jgi:hypothetical protein